MKEHDRKRKKDLVVNVGNCALFAITAVFCPVMLRNHEECSILRNQLNC